MKFRIGFVSNSSSSSFVCDLCGEAVDGWDMCLEEAEMVRCENGHVVCEQEMDLPKNWREDEGFEKYDEYEIPAKHCPLCRLEEITDHDLLRYVLKVAGKDKQQALAEIRENYANRDEFWKYLGA